MAEDTIFARTCYGTADAVSKFSNKDPTMA